MGRKEKQNGSYPVDRGISEGVKVEERAEMGGPIATQGPGDVWAWAAASVYVWIHGPVAGMLYVDVPGS